MLEPGTLWTQVKERTEQALRCGALQPIPTESTFLEQGKIRFVVRVLPHLARKDAAKQQQEQVPKDKRRNPFLPYEADLFVAELSETHVCLLNKFNVIDHHLLIITRAFEEQETCLTLPDFAAMWTCLKEAGGLAFYNSGTLAGASQPHKHLQLVPLPLALEGPQIPIEPAIASANFSHDLGTSPDLPFQHAIARLDISNQSPESAAAVTLNHYDNLLKAMGLQPDPNSSRPAGAYNLLITQQWMLMVPRSQEYFESISVNSLGFAGTLLVRNEQQLGILKNQGPLSVLQQVAYP